MRLEGVAKAGFYPTPPQTLELLTRLLETSPLAEALAGRKALDPCAGEGEAIVHVARRLRMQAVGIELERYRAVRAKERGVRTFVGDARDYRAQNFPLIWLNPPYDYGDDGVRLETVFVEAFWQAVAPGGVLVLLIPEGSLKGVWGYLNRNYEIVLVARIARTEYPTFQQIAVVAQRREQERLAASPMPESLPYLEEVEGVEFFGASFGEKEVLQPRITRDPEEMRRMAQASPLWRRLEAETSPQVRPLTPLKPAHLALLVAGGMLDLEEIEIEGVPHLLLGVLRKETVHIEEEDKRIERDVYRMGLRALNLADYTLLEVG